ncbi:hypothetical protein [uncultured Microbulbifer sp.]|uniref:hypothetical protein n=1 Tax=uncultured Microbulbifer sp. TaxID=348147 RepID=UPI00261F845E|nr:hypothetical protein [uncultured Microbulbifer sp.]
MAQVDSLDLDRPIIEQLDAIYWLPFNALPVHHYNLGDWHLSFTGRPELQIYVDCNYAPYSTPIDNEESYPRFSGGQPLWDSKSPYIWLTLQPIRNACSVEVGPDDAWVVGSAVFELRVIQVREPSKSGVFDLSDHNQIKHFIFNKHKSDLDYFQKLGRKDYFSAWSLDEIQEYKIKGRNWYEIIDGNLGVNWCFNFYTHLSDRHLLHIAYEPSQFWPPYHIPSEKALSISKSPLWDFMDNLELSKMEEGSQVVTGTIERETTSSWVEDTEGLEGW